ncbi:MAG: FtsX-like permease family protein [Actinomycetes bacterium]
MLQATLAGLRAHRLRLLLTSIAIALGVAFVSGTFVLTDALQAGVDQAIAADAGKVDVVVEPTGRGNPDEPPVIAQDVLERVRSLPGVADAQGLVSGTAPLLGRDGKAVGTVATAGISISTGRLNRMAVVQGAAPAAAGEAVLDENTVERTGYRVGDAITVLDHRERRHTFRLVGVIDTGVRADLAYRGVVGFTAADALRVTGANGYREIDVLAADGVSAARLRADVQRAVGSEHRVITGAQLADRLAAQNNVDSSTFTLMMLAFGLVAMLVAGLVIYNTFNILVAQRVRELALLRCIGASRGQVFGSVLLEALVVGVIASAAGLAAGFGLGAASIAVFGDLGSNLPLGPLSLQPRTVVAALLTGVLVTVGAALLPARTATRTRPVAALSARTEQPTFRAGVLMIASSVVLVLLGAGLTWFGIATGPGDGPLIMVAAGGTLVFLAVLVIGPVLVRPLAGLVGWLPRRLFGVTGRLAVDNSRRNPRRSATTTIALTVGVGLMTLVSVVAASTEAWLTSRLDAEFPVDYQISAQYRDDGRDATVPRAIAAELRTRPEIEQVAETRRAFAMVGGGRHQITTVTDGALGDMLRVEVAEGDLRGFGPGTAVASRQATRRLGVRPGDTVTVETERGRRLDVRVVAVVESDLLFLPGLLVHETDFTRAFGELDDSEIIVNAKDGVAPGVARRVVEAAAAPYPTAQVASMAEMRDEFESVLDTLLLVVAGLLGLSVLISLLGIANTLALSVHERTRESALLRALGLTRAQLRGTLSLEALVLGVVGALVGVALGIVFGWAVVKTQASNVPLEVPVGQILLLIAGSGVAGVLAAVLPARRAARASVVGAIAAT